MRRMEPVKKKAAAKRNATRERILEGAARVFANYSYYAASIRMVGKAARVDHPLVNYYFPTKAALFEKVLKRITDEYYEANTTWYEGLDKLDLESGLALYLDRFFDFVAKHPRSLRIIALNLVQSDEHEDIPGYECIREFFAKINQNVKNALPIQEISSDIEMLISNMNILAINYLGAGHYYASILGKKPGSPQYLKWVKQTMMFAFMSHYHQISSGHKKK